MDAIESSFTDRPEIIARLLQLEDEGMELAPLAEFINGDSSQRDFVAKLVQNGASAAELVPARLNALEWAQGVFGTESSTYQGGLALEKKGVAISDLQGFSDQYGYPDAAKSIIERMVADDLPVTRFDRKDMLGRAVAVEMFGSDSPVIEKFTALCKSGFRPPVN